VLTHWRQIAGRNWRIKRIRTAGAVLAIALGTGAVVWVTCCYESVRRTMLEWADDYIGASHVSIQSPMGKYDVLPERLVREIEGVEGVASVAPLLVQRLPARAVPADTAPPPGGWTPTLRGNGAVDFHGIDLERESAVRDWAADGNLVAGRMLTPDDELACVLEVSIAEEEGVGVGDSFFVWSGPDARMPPTELEIVGLLNRRRIARFQKGIALVRLPVLQQITQKFALVNSIDVVLEDPSLAAVRAASRKLHRAIHRDAPNVHVRSAAARMKRIERAQDQQRVVLVLLSCMALLTALFIILSTLSMGMIERISQLGLLRCVGMTGGQLAWLVVFEVLPLGVLGIVLGVPIGLGLTQITVAAVPQYVGSFTISWWGILLAAGAGLLTTMVAASLPALAALTVSPLEATHPRARRAGAGTLLIVALLALGLLAAQQAVVSYRVQRDLDFVQWSATAVVLLYLTYALAAPVLVWIVSRIAVPITSLLVGVHPRLLQDQVGYAVWRSAGICCGLMVGLSLIVGLIVFNASFKTGWQFPKQFPEAYIWTFGQFRGDVEGTVASVPGVRSFTAANAVNVVVEERGGVMEDVLRSMTWFLGIEPDTFFDLLQLEFIEGDRETALRLLNEGGYVLVASDFAKTRKKGLHEVRDEAGNVVIGNTVRIWLNNRWTTFKVAGVIDSPALDIAASYFQVESEAVVVAVGSVIGTNADLKRVYGIDGRKLILLNFDSGQFAPPPPDWPPPEGSPEARYLTHKHYDASLPVAARWQNYQETQVLAAITAKLHSAQVFFGTARELKDEIDTELTRMTYLLTAVPAVALIVAAIGVANLMTANVASRTKQLATLRAVGATRGLILRLVIGEALVLGLLGSALGLGLGLHLVLNVTAMTERMWGFDVPFAVPWGFVSAAIVLTVGLCMLAGIMPARHAARTNVIAALHVS
jgi:ABC-type antimicrobial peptide transport system permease subunit